MKESIQDYTNQGMSRPPLDHSKLKRRPWKLIVDIYELSVKLRKRERKDVRRSKKKRLLGVLDWAF